MPLSLIFTQPGTYTIEDNGIVGDNTSVIKDSGGNVIFTFAHPADSFTLTTFTSGVNLIFNPTDSFTTSSVTIGSLTDPAQTFDSVVIGNVETSGAVTIASNGSITEGPDADPAADITGGSVVLSAATGVGEAGNAIETQTNFLEAETGTGGIAITNYGGVQIGGISADVGGLSVATSGDIDFTAFGSISLADVDNFASVQGGSTSGNVTLTANGFDSDIYSIVDQDAISAPGGDITLDAGRDILLGTAGLDFDNDVRASGSIELTAGRDVTVSGFADVSSDDFGNATGGGVTVRAGRNIGVTNATGNDGSIGAGGSSGGDLVLVAGAGGLLTVSAPTSSALFSSSGDVRVHADAVAIDAASGITALSGLVSINPVTDGRGIDIGTAADPAFVLGLSDAELDRIFANTLLIGSNDSGTVNVTSAISPLNAGELIIRSGADIFVRADVTTSVSLSLRALDNVHQLAASTITTGTLTVFVDAVNDDPGIGNTATLAGTVVGANVITGNADADTLTGNSADNVLLGMGGADTLNGAGGNDWLDGGTGADTMTGGLGNDTYVVNGSGDNVIENPGEGSDTILSSVSYVLDAGLSIEALGTVDASATTAINLTGNELAQTITGNAGINVLSGLEGNDVLNGLAGNDTLQGGLGVDVLEGGAGDDLLDGGAGTDTAAYTTATSAVFVTLGLAGAQNTRGAGFDALVSIERLIGSSFNDQLTGSSGNDRIEGGAGNDFIRGLAGNDTFFGDEGDDRIEGGDGDDIINGNTGRDTAIYSSAASGVTVNLALETPQNTGGAGIDTLNSIERLIGSNHADTLTGNTSNNVLFGEGGSDTISGDAGSDVIYGGKGNDGLTGGAGADSFIFDTELNVTTNVDSITDFTVGYDKIRLSLDIFAAAGAPGTLDAAAFNTGSAAADASDRIIYDSATGNIFYDPDGTGAQAQTLFANVTAGLALTNADFIVI